MQALTLISTWAMGVTLVGLSLYITHTIHQSRSDSEVEWQDSDLKLTIYAAPRSFLGLQGQRRVLALHSWLALEPSPCVVLLGRHPSLLEVVSSLDPEFCVSVDRDIDYTFLGTPFYHSIVSRARATADGIAVVLEPDVVLLPSFIDVLRHVKDLEQHWLLVATLKNVSDFPFYLETEGEWYKQSQNPATSKEVQEYVKLYGRWPECSRPELLAWNSARVPLHAGVLPPFVYGARYHNEWLLNEALTSNLRLVVDSSDALFAFRTGMDDVAGSIRNWQLDANYHLLRTYGSYVFKLQDVGSNILRLVSCGSSFRFSTERFSSEAPNEGRRYLPTYIRLGKQNPLCIGRQDLLQLDCSLREAPPAKSVSYDYQLESLLVEVAKTEKMVVLTVVSNSYRDMLMSWVCRLRHFNISNYLVAAVDKDIYHFAVLQGLPVFEVSSTLTDSKIEDCIFGTNCFRKITKLKSRTVLQILELGYHVLFSDVDIYWFSNPLSELLSFGPGILAAQTDEYNETEAVNVPRRLNSGFYFAWSDTATITAFRKIIKHAASSKLSEQPSFYDVLCGVGGMHRRGNSTCVEPETNLTVKFLDRMRYPNGAYKLIWESHNVRETCEAYGCVVLHNNWKTGSLQKLERQIRTGLFDYDVVSRMCIHKWQNENSKHFY